MTKLPQDFCLRHLLYITSGMKNTHRAHHQTQLKTQSYSISEIEEIAIYMIKCQRKGPTQRKSSINSHRFLLSLGLNINLVHDIKLYEAGQRATGRCSGDCMAQFFMVRAGEGGKPESLECPEDSHLTTHREPTGEKPTSQPLSQILTQDLEMLTSNNFTAFKARL